MGILIQLKQKKTSTLWKNTERTNLPEAWRVNSKPSIVQFKTSNQIVEDILEEVEIEQPNSDFVSRVEKIRGSIEKINSLMGEQKEMNTINEEALDLIIDRIEKIVDAVEEPEYLTEQFSDYLMESDINYKDLDDSIIAQLELVPETCWDNLLRESSNVEFQLGYYSADNNITSSGYISEGHPGHYDDFMYDFEEGTYIRDKMTWNDLTFAEKKYITSRAPLTDNGYIYSAPSGSVNLVLDVDKLKENIIDLIKEGASNE